MNSKRTTKRVRSASGRIKKEVFPSSEATSGLIQKEVGPSFKGTGNEVAIQALELDDEGISQNAVEPNTGPSPPVPWKNKGAVKKKRRTTNKASRKKRR